jgi:hypothetical protein
MQVLAVFLFMFDVMVLSEVSVSLFLVVFRRLLLIMAVLMIMQIVSLLLFLLRILMVTTGVFLLAFMLMNLLSDINQVRGKQHFGVFITQGIMAVIVWQRANMGHGLEIVVQVFGLLECYVSLRHDLISL